LAEDETPTAPVVIHAIGEFEAKAGETVDLVVLLQPSSPIRTGKDIDNVICLLSSDDSTDCVISVSKMEDPHPARTYYVNKEGWMDPLWPEWEDRRRQDLPDVYHRNGALYAVRREPLLNSGSLITGRKKAYIMPSGDFVGIDTERDLLIAGLLVPRWKKARS
jgi:CMP-N-acetylneuraminic acid synthetase